MATFRPLLLGPRGVRLDKLLDDVAVLAESLIVRDKFLELHTIFELFRCAGSLMTGGMRPHVRGLADATDYLSRAQLVPVT